MCIRDRGKTAIEVPVVQDDPPEEIVEASEEKDVEESEEDSPKKVPSNRASRVGFARKALFRNCDYKSSLNKTLNSIEEAELKEWGEGVFKALRAKSDRTQDNPTVYGTMWSKRTGGRSTDVAAIMDSGSTHPLTTLTVTKALKMEITLLDRELEIVQASGLSLIHI